MPPNRIASGSLTPSLGICSSIDGRHSSITRQTLPWKMVESGVELRLIMPLALTGNFVQSNYPNQTHSAMIFRIEMPYT